MKKKTHKRNRQSLSWQLWQLARSQRLTYSGAIAALAMTNLLLFGVPLIGKFAIDVVTSGNLSHGLPGVNLLSQSHYLWASAAIVVVVTAAAGICQYLRGRWTAMASEAIAENLRLALYSRLHHVQSAFYDSAETGDLVQRCSSDVETLRVFLSDHVVEIGRATLLLMIALPILFWMEPILALMSLILMPPLVVGAYFFFRQVKHLFAETDEAEGRMTTALQENLTGIRVVRAFNRQEHEIDKFAHCNADFRNCNYRMFKLMSLYWGVSDFFALCQLGVVLVGGAAMVSQGRMSVGELFAFITCVGMVLWPVRHLGRVIADAGKAVIALNRVNHILEQAEEDAGRFPANNRADGEIRFEDVCFAYIASEQSAILSDISFTVNAGETLGIVGAPGSGKTSLIRLLLKLYDYQSGSITIDGTELRELDRHWLRNQIAVVYQQPFLFSRSIAGNLAIGRSDASSIEQQQACEAAALHESIVQFPQGYNTPIGERGVTLSGGQRQRLALSRALLKNPPILILDDSLSAVDTETEKKILASMLKRKGRQTTLIVSHRLSSVRHADRIMVLEGGCICQLGTHEQLAATPGAYQRLCKIQGEVESTVKADLDALSIA